MNDQQPHTILEIGGEGGDSPILTGQTPAAMPDQPYPASGNLPIHWQPFATRLQTVLRRMGEDQFLVLTLKETNRFVQFAAQGALGMRVEVTSNHFLPGRDQLDTKQITALVAMGWNKPTGSPKQATPQNDPNGSSNFFLDIPNTTDFAQLAILAIRTLTEVLDVPHEGFLQYAAYDYAGNTYAVPELQVMRESGDPSLVMSDLADRLLGLLHEATDIHDLAFDDGGDVRLRTQGLPLYIRLVGQPPMVRFVSPLLEDTRPTRKLLDLVNRLNLNGGPARYLAHKNTVLAVLDIPAWPLQADHVVASLDRFGAALPGSIAWLQAELASTAGLRKKTH